MSNHKQKKPFNKVGARQHLVGRVSVENVETLKEESNHDTYERLRRERPDAYIISVDVIMEDPNPLQRFFEMVEEQGMVFSGEELMMQVAVIRKLMEKKQRGEFP